MSNLVQMPLVLAALAFVAGYVLAKLDVLLRRRGDDRPAESPRDRQFRSMEAELRVAQKKLEQAGQDLRSRDTQLGELRAELDELRAGDGARYAELELLQKQLREECEKTRRLRAELSERAEQSIRAQVRLKDVETELSLAQAGSEAVNDEIARLNAEHEELTARLEALRKRASEEPAKSARPAGPDLLLDC